LRGEADPDLDAHGGARESDVLPRAPSHPPARVLPSPRPREVRLPGYAAYPRLPRPGRRPVPSRAGNASRGPPAPGLASHGQRLAYRLVEAQASAHQGLNLLCGGGGAASLEQCGSPKGRDTTDRAAPDAAPAA